MPRQLQEWTCSICSYTWVIQSTQIDTSLTREDAGLIIGYPTCVNEVYGLMSAQCMINAFSHYGLHSQQLWCSFDTAYSICREHTGVINPIGMYHFMAIRGIDGDSIWVANSAPGYCGVYNFLSRSQFNNLSPVQLIYLT